ncbi:uncharacterized protein PRCAT00001606001 [Priceomyces carsonii]|uniref:uncharacterized protein n=1 Tax=Priceomyces carsonii TaxID=28549 RepID=UPI002ED8159D|nr:unnamed protein product [Priceomyces carsonii]
MVGVMKHSDTVDNLNVISRRNLSQRENLKINDTDSTLQGENSQRDSDIEIERSENSSSVEPEDINPSDFVKNDRTQFIKSLHHINSQSRSRINRRRNSTNASKESKYVSKYGDIKFYQRSATIFDSDSFKNSDFYGIYILFWFSTSFLIFDNLINFYFESSSSFFNTPVFHTLRRDILKVALSDLGMYFSSYFAYFVQLGCLKGWITWNKTGWWVQGSYQFLFLMFWIEFSSQRVMDFPWIAKIFLMLHSCVFLMKMHSYGFYNGYLWNILNELKFSESYLKRLEASPNQLAQEFDYEETIITLRNSITFCRFELEYQSMATTLSTEFEIEKDSLDMNIKELQESNFVKFPQNINLFNYFEYSMFPTAIYTLNFPRTPKIRWTYVFEKTSAIFGILFLMVTVAQNWIYPLVLRCLALRQLPFKERFIPFAFIFLDIVPPFLLEYILTFFLIWDSILNDIAELSRFGDRDFYGPWWNCTEWSEYARLWNKPVHKFLLRHVYHSSISAFKFNKVQASLVTFIISSLLHELAMFVIFGTLRGYLLLLQMSQIPLIMLSRTAFMRNKKVLGIVICWFGFITGPSMICMLYLIF